MLTRQSDNSSQACKHVYADFKQLYLVRLMCIADLDTILLEVYSSVWSEGTNACSTGWQRRRFACSRPVASIDYQGISPLDDLAVDFSHCGLYQDLAGVSNLTYNETDCPF